MPKSKKKRNKPYRPRAINLTAHDAGIKSSCFMPVQDIDLISNKLQQALNIAFMGTYHVGAWRRILWAFFMTMHASTKFDLLSGDAVELFMHGHQLLENASNRMRQHKTGALNAEERKFLELLAELYREVAFQCTIGQWAQIEHLVESEIRSTVKGDADEYLRSMEF